MKKNIKKLFPVLVAASCLSISANAFAEINPDKVVSNDEASTKTITTTATTEETTENKEAATENKEETATDNKEETTTDKKEEANYTDVELINVNDHLLFPVRTVSTMLGYEVEWVGETKTISLIKSPLSVTFSINKDGYAIGKMAHAPLGQAPVIIDGVSYAPVTLLTELMELTNVSVTEEKSLRITLEKAPEEAKPEEAALTQVEVVSINKEANSILVKDAALGEVVLNLAGEQLINEVENFEVGQKILVQYGEAMTLSLPPMNNPIKITNLKEEVKETATTEETTENKEVATDKKEEATTDKKEEAAANKNETAKA